MNRRSLLRLGLTGLAPSLAYGAQTERAESVLYVNDGGSAKSIPELIAAYKPLAALLGTAAKAPVALRIALRGESFEGVVKAKRPDFLFVKTIDYAGRAIRDDGYAVLAKIDTPYVASFIAAKNSTAKTLDDLVGTDILLPDAETFTAKLALATLRSRKLRALPGYNELGRELPVTPGVVTLRYTRTQDAVVTIVGGGMYPEWRVDGGPFQKVGAVNPTMAKQWKAKGGRILQDMPLMPNWCVLVSKAVPEQTRQAMTHALVTLQDAQGRALLESIGVKNFVMASDQEYLAALSFIGTAPSAGD
jgi:hypothetical protein